MKRSVQAVITAAGLSYCFVGDVETLILSAIFLVATFGKLLAPFDGLFINFYRLSQLHLLTQLVTNNNPPLPGNLTKIGMFFQCPTLVLLALNPT